MGQWARVNGLGLFWPCHTQILLYNSLHFCNASTVNSIVLLKGYILGDNFIVNFVFDCKIDLK